MRARQPIADQGRLQNGSRGDGDRRELTYPDPVRIFLDHVSGTPLGTATVGVRGGFTVTVTIPTSAKAGPHRLVAVASDGDRATAPINVSQPVPRAGPGGRRHPGPGSLPPISHDRGDFPVTTSERSP
jgi:hypothetical protein